MVNSMLPCAHCGAGWRATGNGYQHPHPTKCPHSGLHVGATRVPLWNLRAAAAFTLTKDGVPVVNQRGEGAELTIETLNTWLAYAAEEAKPK